MGIKWTIADPRVRRNFYGTDWLVCHPSNDAILAFCDTENEALRAANRLRFWLQDSTDAPLAHESDGWPVGTKVQAKGIAPGGHNVFLVAAGPVPAEYEGSILLLEPEPWIAGAHAAADYYEPEGFEIAEEVRGGM